MNATTYSMSVIAKRNLLNDEQKGICHRDWYCHPDFGWRGVFGVGSMTDKWTNEWPQEPGWYWFCGRRFRGHPIEFFPVEAIKISNGIAYVAGSHFMEKAEGAEGVWQKAILPELPEEGRE